MEDIKQSQYNKMTNTPVEKLIITLSIPAIINMLVTNIYNMVDTAFVGTLGTSASAAVGIIFGFMSIVQAVGFMFGQGSGSICARLLGAQNDQKASEVASTAFFSSFFIGVFISIFSLIFLNKLVFWLGATATIAPYAKQYLAFILLATPAMCACFTMNNILRYEGKAFIGMIGMISGAILNIVGDAIFIFVLDLGVYGAGLSTCLSQFVSFAILTYMFLSDQTVCKIRISLFKAGLPEIFNVMATGLPSMLRQGLNSLSTIFLNYMASPFGDEAVAAFGIVSRIAFFVFSIGLGVGQGYQPVSGFNYGAGKYSRIRKGYRFTWLLAQIMLMLISTTVIIFNQPILYLFRDDPKVVEIATRALILQCLSQVALPFCVTTEMQLQSTGQKLEASIMAICRAGIFFLPTLYLGATYRGIAGIQEAQPIATLLGLIPATIFAIRFFKKLPKTDL